MGKLKHRKPAGSPIDINLLEGLKQLAENTKIPQSRLLDEAIGDLLKKYEQKGYRVVIGSDSDG